MSKYPPVGASLGPPSESIGAATHWSGSVQPWPQTLCGSCALLWGPVVWTMLTTLLMHHTSRHLMKRAIVLPRDRSFSSVTIEDATQFDIWEWLGGNFILTVPIDWKIHGHKSPTPRNLLRIETRQEEPTNFIKQRRHFVDMGAEMTLAHVYPSEVKHFRGDLLGWWEDNPTLSKIITM